MCVDGEIYEPSIINQNNIIIFEQNRQSSVIPVTLKTLLHVWWRGEAAERTFAIHINLFFSCAYLLGFVCNNIRLFMLVCMYVWCGVCVCFVKNVCAHARVCAYLSWCSAMTKTTRTRDTTWASPIPLADDEYFLPTQFILSTGKFDTLYSLRTPLILLSLQRNSGIKIQK